MRYHRTFGLDPEQLDELEARVEEILPVPWNKGTGRPKSLSLREAIMVTLRNDDDRAGPGNGDSRCWCGGRCEASCARGVTFT